MPGGATPAIPTWRLAYEALPESMKRRIEDVQVRYSMPTDLGYVRASDDHLATLSSITHGLVQVDRLTGARSVWPNVALFNGEVVLGDGDATLLTELLEHCTADRFVYEHEWNVGDLLIWDNVATMHRREPFDPSSRRILRHLTVWRS